jgi:hypothetical protein
MSKETEKIAINSCIEALTRKARQAADGAQAMHYSQATLNMAQVRVALDTEPP